MAKRTKTEKQTTSTESLDFESAMKADAEQYGRFYREMLASGIYLAPSQFEAAFISAAHTSSDLELALEKTESSFKKIVE